MGQDMSVIINRARYAAVDKEIKRFAEKWFLDPAFVRYEAYNYRFGIIANENKLKESADYAAYKLKHADESLPKFKFFKMMINDFRDTLMKEIAPLLR